MVIGQNKKTSAMVDESARVVIGTLVPWDLTKEIGAVEIEQKAGDAIGCFMSFAKSHFSKVGSVLSKEQLAEYKKQVGQHAQGKDISDDLLEKLAGQTMVDVVILHPNIPATKHIAINMYVDDKGMAKQLPVNERASSICRACGLNVQVLGDAFIGKQFDDEEGFQRIDFSPQDLSGGDWLETARKINLARQTEENAAKLRAMMEDKEKTEAEKKKDEEIRKKLQLDRKRKRATHHKERGNEFFSKRKYIEAIEQYDKGMEELDVTDIDQLESNDDPVLHALLSNRSACYHLLGKFDQALKDAEACARLRPSWPKAFGRKAEALIGLGRVEEAKVALKHAIDLNPATGAEFQKRLTSI